MARCEHPLLDVRAAPGKGRGLFARKQIASGTILEEAHVVIVDAGSLNATPLRGYSFWWSETEEAVALGLISLGNHDSAPNATVVLDHAMGCIRLVAARTIPADEEVTYDYGSHLWFDAL